MCKGTLQKLQKPYGTLESVNFKDLNRMNKPKPAYVRVRALHFVGFLKGNLSGLMNSASSLQNKQIERHQQVISVQAELSDRKTE